MLVRLRESGRLTGLVETFTTAHMAPLTQEVVAGGPVDSESYECDALIVYAGNFQAMDGEVKLSDADLERLVKNHNSRLATLLAESATHKASDLPPIQVDHTESGWDTVGRVKGFLRLGEFTPSGEKNPKKAIYGTLCFLGKENCTRAKDGRWASLSVGANFEDGVLNEVTVTPFPAAKQAAILKAKLAAKSNLNDDEPSGGSTMDKEKLKKHLMASTKCSEKEAEEKLSKMSDDDMKKMSSEVDEAEKKLSEESKEDKEAEKKLAAEKEEEAKKLAAEEKEKEEKLAAEKKDEEDKKMADDDKEEKEAEKKLSAAKVAFVKLARGMRKEFKGADLEGRKIRLSARLNGLRMKAAITPAEVKRYNIEDLAKKSDEAIDAFFLGFENREPVIQVGQYGSAKAEPVARLAASAKEESLMAESLSNMPFTSKATGDKLTKGKKTATKTMAERHEEAADDKRHTQMSAGEIDSDAEKRLSALAETNKRLENQFEDLLKMVSPILGVEVDEKA